MNYFLLQKIIMDMMWRNDFKLYQTEDGFKENPKAPSQIFYDLRGDKKLNI